MKVKLSISIDEETVLKIDEKLEQKLFRNKSHLIEYAVNKFLEKGELNED